MIQYKWDKLCSWINGSDKMASQLRYIMSRVKLSGGNEGICSEGELYDAIDICVKEYDHYLNIKGLGVKGVMALQKYCSKELLIGNRNSHIMIATREAVNIATGNAAYLGYRMRSVNELLKAKRDEKKESVETMRDIDAEILELEAKKKEIDSRIRRLREYGEIIYKDVRVCKSERDGKWRVFVNCDDVSLNWITIIRKDTKEEVVEQMQNLIEQLQVALKKTNQEIDVA